MSGRGGPPNPMGGRGSASGAGGSGSHPTMNALAASSAASQAAAFYAPATTARGATGHPFPVMPTAGASQSSPQEARRQLFQMQQSQQQFLQMQQALHRQQQQQNAAMASVRASSAGPGTAPNSLHLYNRPRQMSANSLGGVPTSTKVSQLSAGAPAATVALNRPMELPKKLVPPTQLQKPSSKSSKSGDGGSNTTQNLVANSSTPTSQKPTVATGSSSSLQISLPPPAPALTPEQSKKLLKKCDWVDQVLWVGRQILGGTSLTGKAINGFARATSTAQRIKKQRARQTGFKIDRTAQADEQAQEEALKKATMNIRTAKKIRGELKQGVEFCKTMHDTIRCILSELDPSVTIPVLEEKGPRTDPSLLVTHQQQQHARRLSSSNTTSATAAVSSGHPKGTTASTKVSKSSKSSGPPPAPASSAAAARSTSVTSTSSAGDPSGSTLRKLRKRKGSNLSQIPVLPEGLSEYDPLTGKRKYTKKEHAWRVYEVLRFRALQPGDYVAARVSSRDLFILARVRDPYPGAEMSPVDFLKLSEAKRDALFRDRKVSVEDVEDNDTYNVERSRILPLPRSYAEANDWGGRLKRSSRVYAMYPKSTSLYSATVLDPTTYCRGEDDIIVVEFDDDDQDATGALPQYHIPARFVSLIPREFSASAATGTSNNSAGHASSKTAGKKRGASETAAPQKAAKRASQSRQSDASNKHNSKRPDDDNALKEVISSMDFSKDQDLELDQFDLGLAGL